MPRDFLQSVTSGKTLADFKIGVPRRGFLDTPTDIDPMPHSCPVEIKKATEAAIDRMAHLGAKIIDSTEMDLSNEEVQAFTGKMITKLEYEFKSDVEAYFAGLRNTTIRTLVDLVKFNDANSVSLSDWRFTHHHSGNRDATTILLSRTIGRVSRS